MERFAHTADRADQTCAWDSGVESQPSARAAPSSKMDTSFRVRRRRLEKELPSVEPARPQPKRRRKNMRESSTSCAVLPRISRPFSRYRSTISFLLLALFAALLVPGAQAVFISGIENCLDETTKHSNPLLLQFTPFWLSAVFDSSSPKHNLNITIYGNVSGQSVFGDYPPPNDPGWTNPNDTFGKILNYSSTETGEVFTTLDSTVKVLTYTPFFTKTPFWGAVINGSVPLGPSFYVDPSNPYDLSTFSVQHDFDSSYAFSTFAATFRIVSGESGARTLGCISANITPDLGSALSNAIRYLPAAVLALMGMATVAAAILSPWGTSDPFRWTSNYGRDEDLLRLVTPGFGDCLQYIQFIVLTGGLNLAYPGYYQPVVSRAAWSSLMFNESFASHGHGFQPVVDGVYHTNGTYGLTRMRQLVGMSSDEDIWPCLAVFLLGITLCIILLCQLGFLGRWGYRALSNTTEEDLRSKNWPFTAGNIVRIVFNYLLLPIVALSMFQMVKARETTSAVVAMAVVLLAAVIGFATWIFYVIFTTRPRAYLFDDLPTVLMLGPLYNTYSDDAAPFAFIPVLLTFLRGVAIGAIQPSGIAQLVILAICEIVLILTLNTFRPFQANTSMNAYHTFFSVIRLVTTLLSVAFVPSLGVTEGPKGWFGYIILLLHAIVLVFGFFLNALQTLIEVFARLAGAGDARGGLTKVFGVRQLKRRGHQRNQRSSLTSDAAMLSPEQDQKSLQLVDGGRSRSMSASSAVLLNNHRMSAGFDRSSQGGEFSVGGMSSGPGTPGGAASPFTYLPSGNSAAGPSALRSPSNLKPGEAMMDPYYRPPRLRRPTLEGFTPGDKSRASWIGGDQVRPYKDSPEQGDASEFGESAAVASNRGSMTPAYLRSQRDDSDLNLPAGRGNTDYAVREADFYYGVSRGPALSNLPTRRLKTGPADPMGPVASASTWLKGFFVGKRRDKGKGFEVIRSTRAPPQMMPLEEVDSSPPLDDEPYHDSPEGASARRTARRGSDDGFDGDDSDPYELRVHRVSEAPPALAPIETVGGIDLPSRMGSRSTVKPARESSTKSQAPTIPRKSSRRTESREIPPGFDFSRLSTVPASPTMESHMNSLASSSSHLHPYQPGTTPPMQLPFVSGEPSPSPERTSQASSIYPPGEEPAHPDHRGPFLGPAAAAERPVSTGYVQHHVAGERIQPGLYDANAHLGTEAELVDLAMTRSRSTGRSTEHSNH